MEMRGEMRKGEREVHRLILAVFADGVRDKSEELEGAVFVATGASSTGTCTYWAGRRMSIGIEGT